MNDSVKTVVFSDEVLLREYVEEIIQGNSKTDVFVFCDEVFLQGCFETGIDLSVIGENHIALIDECSETNMVSEYVLIDKYQSVEKLCKGMHSFITQSKRQVDKESVGIQSDEVKQNDKQLDSVSFIIASRTEDCTNFAYALNDKLNNKYLVIDTRLLGDFEEEFFSNNLNSLDSDNRMKLSQLIFTLNSTTLDMDEVFKACIYRRHGMTIISGINEVSDVSCITKECMVKLDKIAHNNGYNGLIILCDAISATELSEVLPLGKVYMFDRHADKEKRLICRLLKRLELWNERNNPEKLMMIGADGINDHLMAKWEDLLHFREERADVGGLFRLVDDICR